MAAASPLMNMLVMKDLLDDDNSDSSDDNLLMMMMMSPGLLGGNQAQADQMSPLLPLMLMDESSDDNNLMLMMMMMQNGPNGMTTNMDQMLPFLILDDDTTDMKSLFLMTTMMQNNCEDTNSQMNMLLPLLLMGEDNTEDGAEADGADRRRREAETEEKSDSLKTLLLLQTMSEGNNGLDINSMMPFLLMEDSSDSDHLMKLVLMSSMTGGMDSSAGFENNFNMLLPLLLGSEDGDKGDEDMLFILLAMQSQAPGSSMNSSAMLPLLMMSSDSNNQELIMFMAMMNNQNCAVVPPVVGPIINPNIIEDAAPESETIYRTWKINEDGSRTLVSEEETD